MRKHSIDALIVFGGDIGVRLLGVATTIYLSRSLGQSGYGVIVIGMSVFRSAVSFGELGLKTLGTREIAKPHDVREYQLSDIVGGRLITALVAAAIALAVSFSLYSDPVQRTVILLFTLCLIPFALLLEWYYQGLRRYIPLTISRFLSGLVYMGGVVLLVTGVDDLVEVPVYYLVSYIAAALFLIALKQPADRLLPSFRNLGTTLRKWGAMFRSSAAIGVGGVLAQSVQLLPPFAIDFFGSKAQVGTFDVATKAVQLVLIVDRVFSTIYLPVIAGRWSVRRENIEEVLQPLLRLIVWCGFSLCALISIFSHDLLTLIFSEEYAAGAPALSVLSWFTVATLLNSFFSFSLIATGREREYLRSNIIGGIAAVSAILIGTAFWDIVGTAFAVVIGEALFASFMYLRFKRYFSLRLFKPLLSAAPVSAAVMAGAYMLDINRLPFLPLVLAALALPAFLLGGIRSSDIALLWKKQEQ